MKFLGVVEDNFINSDCMIIKEKNKKEDNNKEKDKNKSYKRLWKKFNQNWLWINIGSYIVGSIIFWGLFFIGIINMITVIFLTILNLIIIPMIYYLFKRIKVSKHQTIIVKIIWVGCGLLALGVPIWFFIGYTLIMAPWAPLNSLTGVIKGRILILVVLSSYGLAAYIMYVIGKKREWKLLSY